MTRKKRFIFIVLVLSFGLSSAQIRLSETIQTSKIADRDSNALYFIEFWATWCGPCVYAHEYLQVLQSQNPDDLFVIALSEENPTKVKRHLEKYTSQLEVAIDFDGENFKLNNIRTLPYGLLINSESKIVWKGNPTDLKANELDRLLEKNIKRSSYDDMFILTQTESLKDIVYIPKTEFEIKEMQGYDIESLQISEEEAYLNYKGDLISLLAHILKVVKNQVVISEELNKTYDIYIQNDLDLLSYLKEGLNIEITETKGVGNVLVVNNSNPKFWNKNQLDWGDKSGEFLIDDSQIKADNVTFNELLYRLSLVLNIPVKVTHKYNMNAKHDWIFHYKYFDLMKMDLSDNFGLLVERKSGEFVKYNIIKKAP